MDTIGEDPTAGPVDPSVETVRDYWDNQPAYLRIANDIAVHIDSGEWPHGHQLPTEATLQETYGVSRTPVRDALTVLHRRGYVTSQRGRGRAGTYVHRPPLLSLTLGTGADEDPVDGFHRVVRAQGRRPSETVTVERVVADGSLALALQVDPGAVVTVRRRVRSVDGMPYALADTYFPAELVIGSALDSPGVLPAGETAALVKLDAALTTHRDVIDGRPPRPLEGRRLALAPDVWCFVHQRTSAAASGNPVRHLIQVLPVDRWRLHVTPRAGRPQ